MNPIEVLAANGVDAKDTWRLWPHSFAKKASQGKWMPYPWLKKLSLTITPLLLAGNARILISAPPQHGKSEFLSNWVPTWFLNMWPEKKVILGTYSQDYANKFGAKVRENLLENPISAIPMRRDTISKKKFATQAGGQMMVAGVGGPATGESAHLFIVDDPYKSYVDASSETLRENVMSWFRSVATTRLQSGGSVIIMHTRWVDDDLIGELSKEQGWTYINLEAICSEPETDLLERKEGDPLCPERYTLDDLTRIRREVTDLFWFPMYMGTPVDAQGGIVTIKDVQFYDVLPPMEQVAIFADLSYEKGEENDPAVFEAWGMNGANIYLIAQIRGQMGFTEQIEAFIRMMNLYPDALHKEIEKKANGAAVIDIFQAKVPGVFANNPQTSKGARLAVASPLYKSHNVWYPNPVLQPWVKENLYELVRMTLSGPKSKHDDTVDTASMAVTHFGKQSNALASLIALGSW